MKVRIAVASTDGKVVNQHFGRADKLLKYEEIQRMLKGDKRKCQN